MVISILIPIAVVAVILLVFTGSKVDSLKGGEDMLKNVFIYLVLFATLMMTIGGSISVFMAAADIVSPAPYYQSFAEYKQFGEGVKSPSGEGETKLSEDELLERYNAMVSSEQERQVMRAKNSLIKSLGWILIPFPVFIFFRRRLPGKEEV